MKNLKDKSVNWGTSQGVQLFTDLLKENKIILGPSDTVLGLYGLPLQEVFLGLNKLKNRCEKPYLLLVRDQKVAAEYVKKGQLEKFQKVFDACWPGPLTVIAQAKEGLPFWITSGQKTVALRVPQHRILKEVLGSLSTLFSTSANLAGQHVPLQIEDVDQSIRDSVDAIVEDYSLQSSVPSTLIDISSGDLKVIREGVYTKKDLLKIIAE